MTDANKPESTAEKLAEALENLNALVWGECPSLLNEDSGGNSALAMEIDEALAAYRAQPAADGAQRVDRMSDEQERTAFEAAMRRDTFDTLERLSDGSYKSYEARVGWVMWIASAACSR